MFLFDLSPISSGAGAGIFLVVAFFFVALGSGVFAFVMLRKTIKMAIRMAVVAVVLLIAVFGSVALWWFLKPSPAPYRPNRPPVNQSR